MSGSHEALTTPEILLPGDIAVVFPGQGSHWVGMGRQLFEQSEAARKIFQQADATVGFSLSQICFEGLAEQLAETAIAQLAIATVCVAAYEAIKGVYPNFQPLVGGGVSFGELPNLVAAGVIDFPTLLRLVMQRGAIMEEAARENPGRMVAVIGLDKREIINQVCQETGTYPAIWYPGLSVISGGNNQINEAKRRFGENYKVSETEILYPFHTPLMTKAEQNLREVLSAIPFNNAHYAVVLNATGETTTSGKAIKEALPQQLTGAVDVPRSLNTMYQLGARLFVEFCPKPVVAGHVRRLIKDVTAVSVHDAQSLQNLSQLLTV